ncbi:DUF5996 family protein [Rubrivirga sp. S365]|uniref:DUF5996 family protein n=1 Tax=Rubrivirga litoralis TaxID=3075598 RepID=A0ABU3BPG0_9BACT|nr:MULTISPECIES: DUF5996 family protein [unclassified Rubrivirga]MDT0631165.1 DUF5996 family protein [Rubrivirga sp. F394]MDT7856692.1 DUF5996 family protein [Rubrivirga sp. S365]
MTWPPLPLDDWQDTYDTLHRWTQVVGKVRMEGTPWVNHSWHVPLYVTARGLSTGLVPSQGGFEVEFDFVDHRLSISTTQGERRSFALRPMTVAAFYASFTEALADLGIEVEILARPVELEDATPFPDDTEHAAYDADAAQRHWRVLVQAHRVFTDFRARFLGKVSPVHFFWGAFDLAVTRFSGREAPTHPGGVPNCADWVMEEAYSRELSSAGFWAGAGLGEAAFYAYAYPQPEGFSEWAVEPAAAYFHDDLGEFVLPYEAVRTADDPDAVLMEFLQSTYEAAADLADWDRAGLERESAPPA